MTSNWLSDIRAETSRLDARVSDGLHRRIDGELPFDAAGRDMAKPLLLDTNVYLDAQKGKLPIEVGKALVDSPILHSATVIGEMTFTLAMLDPTNLKTSANRDLVFRTLMDIPATRIVSPSARAIAIASLRAGYVSRVLSYPKESRRKLLNDAVIFETARENGATLISANVVDYDRLLQIDPEVSVVLYRAI